jgi:hypothetical protein
VEDDMTTRAIDTDARDQERREAEEDERHDDEGRWTDEELRDDDAPGSGWRRDRERGLEDGEFGDEGVGDSATGGRGGWDDDEPIAPRPRGRLLRPLPLALIAVAIAAAGFLGGVEAQKGSEGGTASGPGGGNLPSFAATGGPTSSGGEAAGAESGTGKAAAGGAGATGEAAATGTVTSVEGHTIYVKESDGTVVAVKAGDGSTVTRDSNVAAKKVHPGDTVVVQGSKHGSTVKASSIAATESGVESTVGFGGPTATSGGGTGSEGSGSEAEASVESLFEE